MWCLVGWLAFLGQGRAAMLFEAGAPWRFKKATEEASLPDTTAWRQRAFEDRGWSEGPAPFYYGEPLTGTALNDMRGAYTGVYLRKTFVVRDPAEIAAVRLRALSDDGFAAWINGQPVVGFNVPAGEIPYTGTALQTFNEPLPTEVYDLIGFRDILVPGTNVIAVQALNVSLGNSSDFVFDAALEVVVDEQAPVMLSTVPAAGSRVATLTQVQLIFDEPVTGVDAGDLLFNGVAATNVTAFGADQYVFEFAAQPRGLVNVRWAAAAGIHDLSTRQNAFAGGDWSYTVDPDLPPPGVRISEFLADNDRTLNDEDGDASDWIELANSSDQTVNLAGWALTDTAADPMKWRFPSVSIAPRGFLLVFASGKNRAIPTAPLHTNFRLEKGRGYLALVRPGGGVASDFGAAYPPQEEDVSYGRLATDPLQTGYFPRPTPRAVNSEGGPGFSSDVGFSRIGGTFIEPFALILNTSDPGAVVRYTLDDTVPTVASPAYSGPLPVNASVRVRARAFSAGLLPGPVRSEYFVQLQPSGASVTSSLPLVLLHGFGRGAVPAGGEYPAFVSIYEPRSGVASLTNAPDLRTRARLNIRGSSTLSQAKRNYSVEFRDDQEADRDLAPLGMPADSDWILYAPNNFEPILIHNPLAFQLSRDLGRYAPRTRFVEVYVQTATGPVSSGAYAGIYVLMEKIKRGSDRVDIANLQPEHAREPQVTGGYMLKVDRLDPGDGGLYAAGQAMGWVEPKEEEITQPQRAPQRAYLQNYLDRFGTALYAGDWRDPVRGWRAYVEEGSWIDHHLLNVLTFNVDALRLSAYFYKPRGGKLEFGPLWDFDRALNSTDGRDANPRVWRSQVSDRGTDFFNYPWWGRMFQDPDFWQAWIDRYQELRRDQGAFSTDHLFALVDQMTGELRSAQPREVARWPGFTSPRGSYEAEIASLKTWLARRLDFMDTNFLAMPVLSRPGGTIAPGATLTLRGPPGATVYYTLDGTDPRAIGGGPAAAAQTNSGPISLGNGAMIRARSRNPNHRNRTGADHPPLSSVWSGIVAARFHAVPGPEPGVLALTEIQYRPAAPSPAELAQNPLLTAGDFEFLELRNLGPAAVDLGDLRFTRGVQFHFSTSSVPTLGGGERLVLVRNRAAFALRYGTVPSLAGQYDGSLAGSGERLRVEDGLGRVILDCDYQNGWHPATDALGFTLVAVQDGAMAAAVAGPRAWRASAAVGGSPGGADPIPPLLPDVVINEVLSHTDPPQYDGVELRNLSTEPAEVGGWWLTDDRSVPARYRLPEGTVIPAGGHLWIDERAFNADPAAPTSFRLDSLGDGAWIFAADATGRLLGPAHGFAYGPAPNGVSFGRELTCDGEEEFVLQSAATPGSANPGPARSPVVITEVHYHPPDILLGDVRVDDTSLEFVEIANLSEFPVALFDPARPTNRWRLKDAVGFVFPTNLTLAARAVGVVVNFDPDRNPQALARFRSTFKLPDSVLLFGPFDGSLPNSSGRVELARPDPPQGPGDPDPGFVPAIVMDRVAYEDAPPWAVLADGTGRSLQRVNFASLPHEARAWVAALPTPGALPVLGLDTDGDGQPDAWESVHCLDPSDSGDGLSDADGDQASNHSEWVAGTDPRDPADVLGWVGISVSLVGTELRFTAKAGHSYRVQFLDELGPGTWQTLATVPLEGSTRTVTVRDPASGGMGRFYRLRTPAGL